MHSRVHHLETWLKAAVQRLNNVAPNPSILDCIIIGMVEGSRASLEHVDRLAAWPLNSPMGWRETVSE